MKIAITGHTQGLGKVLFTHFSGSNEVIGFSRSTGCDLMKREDLEQVAEVAATCDVFFNNAYAGCAQGTLLAMLACKTRVVSSGSMAACVGTKTLDYEAHKHRLEFVHEQLRSSVNRKPMLMLRMGWLPNYPEFNPISYEEIINAVEYWLRNPRVTLMEFANQVPPADH